MSTAEIIKVQRKRTHPSYVQTREVNDITVLLLAAASAAAPVPMATVAEVNAAAETTLVGFGNNDVNSTMGFGLKRQVSVPITSIRRAAGDNLSADESLCGFDSHLEFVAGGGGRDSCNGDSGGPAFIVVNGQKRVGGLTSRAADNATHPCGEAGIYIRVDANAGFVVEFAQQNGINI